MGLEEYIEHMRRLNREREQQEQFEGELGPEPAEDDESSADPS